MSLILQSSGGGQITIQEPTTANNFTQTLPASTGTILTTGSPQSGSVIQVVSVILDTTASFTPNGTPTAVTGLAAVITPRFSTSRVLIQSSLCYGTAGPVTTYGGYYTRNGTAIGLGAAGASQQRVSFGLCFTPDSNQVLQAAFMLLDSPASTSAITYQVVVQNDNTQPIFINRSANDTNSATGKRGASTITLMEIAA
jgi:hypothetical protein